MKVRREMIITIIGAIFLIVFFVSIARNVTLTCGRVTSNKEVNCVRHTSLLGLIPLEAQEIYDVRGATVTESESDDSISSRIELVTPQGNVSLTDIYFGGGLSERNAIAARIYGFVEDASGQNSITITDPGLFTSVNFINISLGFLISFGWFLFKKQRISKQSEAVGVPNAVSVPDEGFLKSKLKPTASLMTNTSLDTPQPIRRMPDRSDVQAHLRLLRDALVIFVIVLVGLQILGLGMAIPVSITVAILVVAGYLFYYLLTKKG